MTDGAKRWREVLERFFDKVEIGKWDECWQWVAGKTHDGYGQFWLNGKHKRAHRLMYEWLVMPIPKHLQIDHICRNRACVRPSHMELVTSRENTKRAVWDPETRKRVSSLGGQATGRMRRSRTHCPHGHPYDKENSMFNKQCHRRCGACCRNRYRKKVGLRGYGSRRKLKAGKGPDHDRD